MDSSEALRSTVFVSVMLARSMTETVPAPQLATYSLVPSGEMAMELGSASTGRRAVICGNPSLPFEMRMTSLEARSTTNASVSSLLSTAAQGSFSPSSKTACVVPVAASGFVRSSVTTRISPERLATTDQPLVTDSTTAEPIVLVKRASPGRGGSTGGSSSPVSLVSG